MLERNPIIISVSDVHLGGGNSAKDLFREFVHEINLIYHSETIQKPKVLIILGDIFDVMMNTYENISTEFLDIFKLLDDLYQKGLKIIIALGNHEVSVTGDYDTKFTARKLSVIERLLEYLKEHHFEPKFISKKNICQYIVIENQILNGNGQWHIHLYDSKYQIPNKMPNNLRPIEIGESNFEDAYKCLCCHGYQFFKAATKWSGEFIWNPLLKAKPSTKDRMNRFYNTMGVRDVLKKTTHSTKAVLDDIWDQFQYDFDEDELDENQKKLLNQYYEDFEKKDEQESSENGHKIKVPSFIKDVGKSIKNLAKKNRDKTKAYISQHFFLSILNKMAQTDEIIEDLKKIKDVDERIVGYLREEMFNDVSHVIYGHTHNKIHTQLKGVTLVNDGAWQHANPSYVLFYPNGDLEIKNYPENRLLDEFKKGTKMN